MNLYLTRHGRTNFNDLELCNDDPGVDVHLTDSGIVQAEAAAEELQEVKLERIISSPLPRTRQTAAIINRYHHLKIETHPDIADIRSGFDGRPVADYFAAVAHDPLNARVNGGESLLDHKRRVMGFIDWLAQQPEQNILVVAHEETMRVFIAHYEGGVPDEGLRDLHVGNCEIRHYQI